MAQQGSGLGAGPDPAMQDRTQSSPINPRSGAAKKALTSFDTKWGMKDQTVLSGNTAGISPSDPGKGPDASSPNPLDPEAPVKVLRKQPLPGQMKTPWGMVDANGKGVDQNAAGKVLGEAILSGSTKLPGSVSAASGPAPAYNGRDPN